MKSIWIAALLSTCIYSAISQRPSRPPPQTRPPVTGTPGQGGRWPGGGLPRPGEEGPGGRSGPQRPRGERPMPGQEQPQEEPTGPSGPGPTLPSPGDERPSREPPGLKKRGSEDRRPEDRESKEGRSDERGPEDRGPDGRKPEDREPDGRKPEDRGPDGKKPEDRGPDGKKPEDRGPDVKRPEDQGPDGRSNEDREPGDRGSGERGPPKDKNLPEERTISEAGVFAKTLGKSGKIMIGRHKSPEKDSNGITIEFGSIYELDSNGKRISGGKKKHAFPTFSKQKFVFSSAVNITYQTYKVTTFNFTANLTGIDATVRVQLLIFRENANITNGDEDIYIEKGNVKFNIEIKNWPFCGNETRDECKGNRIGQWLELVIAVKGNEPPKRKDENRPRPGKGKSKSRDDGKLSKPGKSDEEPSGPGKGKGKDKIPPFPDSEERENDRPRVPQPPGADDRPEIPTIPGDGPRTTIPQGYADTSGESKEKSGESQEKKDKGQFYSTGANSGVFLSSKVEVDGSIEDMPSGFPKYERRGRKESFVFRFPKFQEQVFYDPVIVPSEEFSSIDAANIVNGSTSLAPQLSSLFIITFFVTLMRLF